VERGGTKKNPLTNCKQVSLSALLKFKLTGIIVHMACIITAAITSCSFHCNGNPLLLLMLYNSTKLKELYELTGKKYSPPRSLTIAENQYLAGSQKVSL